MGKLSKIGINTIRGLSVPAINFSFTIVGIHVFGKSDWGYLISINLWAFFVAFIANWGNKDYLVRSFSKAPSKIHEKYWLNLFTRAPLLLVGLALFFFFPTKIAALGILLSVLAFLFNSFDSLIVYYQKFSMQLFADVLGGTIVIGGVFWIGEFNLEYLLWLYCLNYFIKIIVFFFHLKVWKWHIKFKGKIEELKNSYFFFMIGFTSFLNSKIDLYLVNIFLNPETLSEYQLISSAFLILQSLAAHIITPISKQLYRTKKHTSDRIQKIINYLSVPTVVLGSISIFVVFENIMNLGVDWKIYLFGGITSLPVFYYVLKILNIYKVKQEKFVLKTMMVSIVINATSSILLMPFWGLMGAVFSTMISQWIFYFMIRNH